MAIELTTVGAILTRTSGYLTTVCSHSLQPYRGCAFGRSLCGVGCYVQHSGHITQGREWGSFLEARTNAAESYLRTVARERRWGRVARGEFRIFLSSATEPFPPQESRLGITRSILLAMNDEPPDGLILQTHSHLVVEVLPKLIDLSGRCDLRIHLSIETDREVIPGLPAHASSISRRFKAAKALREAGLQVFVTVSPLLPVADPNGFFARIAEVADGVILDHYIGGDGSPNGSRTLRTGLPAAMAIVESTSTSLDYLDRMVAVARRYLPDRTGVGIDGFAGRWLAPESD